MTGAARARGLRSARPRPRAYVARGLVVCEQASPIVKANGLARPQTNEQEAGMTITLQSSHLREGDIVWCHGMRCLIDEPISSRASLRPRGQFDRAVYFTHARVLNREDVPAECVPYSFTPEDANGVRRWAIQGNDLALWCVEERVERCPDCGEAISLQPSGWWTHDGLANGCWRASIDGPTRARVAS